MASAAELTAQLEAVVERVEALEARVAELIEKLDEHTEREQRAAARRFTGSALRGF